MVVLKKDVIRRIILFDKVILQYKGFVFVRGDYIVKIGYFRDQNHGLLRLDAAVEILPYPITQFFCLADVEHVIVLVEHDIAPALSGERLKFVGDNLRSVHIMIITQKV